MALWTAIECPTAASLVTWGGVSDMVLTYEERVDMRRMMKRVIGGTPTKCPEQYERRTPLSSVGWLQMPVLIIHGVRDENVSVEHAYRLEKEMKKNNKQVESWYFSEYNHYFPPAMNRKIVERLTSWMKSRVKK